MKNLHSALCAAGLTVIATLGALLPGAAFAQSTTTTTLAGACNNPTVIPAQGGTFSGTTSGTSSQAGSCGNSGSSPERVFQWTPTVSGTATIETCGAGTSFDTVLYMRSGLCASASEVGCNDDACSNSTGLFRASRLTPAVTAGQTYFIVVDGYVGAQGTFSLTVTPPAAATTTTTTLTGSSTTTTTLAGACNNPTVIPAQGGTFGGTTSGTSSQAGSCGNSGTSPEQVFQWTPAVSGTAAIQTCGAGTSFDTVLYVRSPSCTGSEITSGCNDDACTNSAGLFRASKLTPEVTAGTTYFIVVDGYGGAAGSFALQVTPPGAATTTTTTGASTTSTSTTTTTTRPATTTTTTRPATTTTTTASTTTTTTRPPPVAFVQGMAFSTGQVSAVGVTLTRPVAQGDLLVSWVSQYNAPAQVQVSDNVNGTWTRAPGSLTFLDDTGDIALYYRENSQAAPSGMTITVSVSSSAYLQGTVADYSGVAPAGSLDQIVTRRFPDGRSVDTGATAAVDAGELVFAAVITSPGPGSVTPGSSLGIPYTPRAQASSGASFEEDIRSSAAGGQHGTATLSSVTDWYAVCAVFHPYPTTPPVPPSTPTGLRATSVASTRVTLSWSPSTGSVAGYAVYRDGSAIGTTRPDATSFVDEDVTPSATYTYSVDAFDLADDHSAPSVPRTVTTPVASPEFVQGAAASSGPPHLSETLMLTEPVLAGDLLVGWFSQFGASGQVQVFDNVNGRWTRSVSTTWGGSGDIALYYRENSAPAPSGLRVTWSATSGGLANMQGAVADYRHVATLGALDQAVVSDGHGTSASAGPTAPVAAGELVVAAVLTSGQPVFATAGSSQMVPYVLDVRNGSASSDLEDILSCAAGPQQGSLTFGTTDSWHMVVATFHP